MATKSAPVGLQQQPGQPHPGLKQLQHVLEQRGAWEPLCREPSCAQRFLTAANHDVDKACAMLMDMLRWREENGIDALLDNFCFPEREALLAAYPQGYHKTCRNGRPVYIQQLGRADIDALLSVTSEERMLMWHIAEYERLFKVILPACSAVAGRPVQQSFSILDLKGIKFRDFMKVKGVLTSFCKLDNAYYPETSGHMCIINSPPWFGGVFSFFKSSMSAEAQKRVEILGCNWKEQLQRYIAPENLHHEYGGMSHGCITHDIGPWQQWQQQHQQQSDAARSVLMHVRCSSDSGSHIEYAGGLFCAGDKLGTQQQQQQQDAANPIARRSPQLQCRTQPHLHIHVPRMDSYNTCGSEQHTTCEDAAMAQLTPMSAAALSFHSLQTANSGFHTPHSSFAGSLLGASDSHLGEFQDGRSKPGLLMGQVKRVGRIGSSFIGRRPRRRRVGGAADTDGTAGGEEGADFWCPMQDQALWQPPAAKHRHGGSADSRSLLQKAKSGVASSFSFLAGQKSLPNEGWSNDGPQHSGSMGVGSRHGSSSSKDSSSGGHVDRLLSGDALDADEADGSYKVASTGCCGLRRGRK